MSIKGRVVAHLIAQGSKSERTAVLLDTGSEKLILRRKSGNPFRDPELEKLVGCTINGDGIRRGNTFIMTQWTVEQPG